MQHYFFDLDNTLSRSRTPLEDEYIPTLKKLASASDVIVVTGGQTSQIQKQLDPTKIGAYYMLAQNGNHAVAPDGTTLWERRLTDVQKHAILALVTKMRAHLNLTVKDPRDLIEDRGSSICYSLIGHHEDISIKEKFDPDHAKRLGLLEHFKDAVEQLRSDFAIEIRSGGTTTLDFFQAGKNKGYNVAELIDLKGWNKDECIYIGDALFPGGNDETVIGVIQTMSVKDYHETYRYLAEVVG